MGKLDRKTLRTFRDVPSVAEGFLSPIPEETLDVKRSETAWTAREHFYHIVDVQEMLLGRIRLIMEKEDPVIVPFFPEDEAIGQYASLEEAFGVFRKFRKEQYRTVRKLPRDILLREASHKEYSEYNIPKIIKHMIFHEYWHLYRIEEICHTREGFFE